LQFVNLYEGQPSFGEVDQELRAQGFVPHAFTALKKWSIAPLEFGGDPTRPLHQLLEADLVYVRDFVHAESMSSEQLKQFGLIAHSCYGSFDLAGRCVAVLEQRKILAAGGPPATHRDPAAQRLIRSCSQRSGQTAATAAAIPTNHSTS
jgi:hypothetical protein